MTFAKRVPAFSCAACSRPRTLGELLLVTRLASGYRRYICRPEISGQCFAFSVGSRAVESITLASEGAPE